MAPEAHIPRRSIPWNLCLTEVNFLFRLFFLALLSDHPFLAKQVYSACACKKRRLIDRTVNTALILGARQIAASENICLKKQGKSAARASARRVCIVTRNNEYMTM